MTCGIREWLAALMFACVACKDVSSPSTRRTMRPQTLVLLVTPKMISDFGRPDSSISAFLTHYEPLITHSSLTIVIFAVGNSDHILEGLGELRHSRAACRGCIHVCNRTGGSSRGSIVRRLPRRSDSAVSRRSWLRRNSLQQSTRHARQVAARRRARLYRWRGGGNHGILSLRAPVTCRSRPHLAGLIQQLGRRA